jgi:hypothetical protein
MAFRQQLRPPLLEKLVLIVRDLPFPFFLVHNRTASCYNVEFVTLRT